MWLFFHNFSEHSTNSSNFCPSTHPLTLHLARRRAAACVCLCWFQQMKCNNRPVAEQIHYCQEKCNAFRPVGWWGSRSRQPSIGTIRGDLYKHPCANLQQLPNVLWKDTITINQGFPSCILHRYEGVLILHYQKNKGRIRLPGFMAKTISLLFPLTLVDILCQ